MEHIHNVNMTVSVPEPLLRSLKLASAQRGQKLKEIVRIAIEKELKKAGKP